jgi:hypothetical protein
MLFLLKIKVIIKSQICEKYDFTIFKIVFDFKGSINFTKSCPKKKIRQMVFI